MARRNVCGSLLEPPKADCLSRMPLPASAMSQALEDALVRTPRPMEAQCSMAGRHAWARRFRDSGGRLLDLRHLDALRLLGALGCRVGAGKTMGSAMKFRTTCPWPSEHSHSLDDDGAVLILEPGRWPTWKCLHSHHAHLGLADLLEAAGVLQ